LACPSGSGFLGCAENGIGLNIGLAHLINQFLLISPRQSRAKCTAFPQVEAFF
jgi:hypothetical protein